MKHLSLVLAAVDFSSAARSGFDHALALATRHGARLVAIQAVPPDLPFNREGQDRHALRASLEQAAGDAGIAFEYRVQHGDAADVILLHAGSLRPDVIVLGTHQRRGFARWRLGSVSERVVATASVPVLVVPAGVRASTGAFRHVAVALDLTPVSEGLVRSALDVASEGTERVTLLHAVPAASSRVPTNLYPYGVAERGRLREARRALQQAVPVERPTRAAIHTRLLRGDTTTELTHAVGTMGADLLVVGVPSRGRVARALIGTTATRLLLGPGVPVLAVPDGSESRAREERASIRRAA